MTKWKNEAEILAAAKLKGKKGMNNKYSRATVVVAVLLVLCMVSLGYGFYKLLHTNIAGQECAIEVQFKDSKATYIGRTV